MIMGPDGPETMIDCAGEDQAGIYMIGRQFTFHVNICLMLETSYALQMCS
jgi:hypothetical protein